MEPSISPPLQLLDQLGKLTTSATANSALMLISLHGLRRIGNIFGSRLSEQIMHDLIQQLECAIRPDDRILRPGRFELAVLISGLQNRGHAVLAANKLADILGTPIEISKKDRKFPFSIGMALSPEHTSDPEQLLRYAEIASLASEITQTPYQIYSHDDLESIVTDWDIEGDLDNAIANNQLSLHYQPKISARDGRLLGAEALMRWRHPVHGMIPPDRFIPVAENMGIMPKLTWWCINTALRERIEWGQPASSLSVAVNISALDLTDERFIKSVLGAIGIWDTPPELLTLEITEGSLMKDIALSADILKRLQSYGIRISIDDFGTGYSSLAYFKQLPADELKIDRSFIVNILDNDLDRHIVSTIVQMARKLRLDIVAEGVETALTQQQLIELGCDIIQGYHIARPMPQAEFIKWSKSHD
ncbi:putative bifunctional diguanylate cyclase/phosphodiesterase [Sedimenticola selenatireducens]|uniref:putative bifunctional diguanylate cyclase/phosphodiesterase n=1 Tax=Sedimenticola selenatireducens TaxID=191960 RepID=UPI00048DBB41|nr:GGDEF domain-containing phosphodiesterase [Sedimenticola selenatireducens]